MTTDETDFLRFSAGTITAIELIASTYDVEKNDGRRNFDVYTFLICQLWQQHWRFKISMAQCIQSRIIGNADCDGYSQFESDWWTIILKQIIWNHFFGFWISVKKEYWIIASTYLIVFVEIVHFKLLFWSSQKCQFLLTDVRTMWNVNDHLALYKHRPATIIYR